MKPFLKIFIICFLSYSCGQKVKTDNFNSLIDCGFSETPKVIGPVKSIHLVTYEAKEKDSIITKSNKIWVQSEPEFTFYDKNGKIIKIVMRHCLCDSEGYNIGYYYDSTLFRYNFDSLKLTQSFDTSGILNFEKHEVFKDGLLRKNSNNIIGSVCNNWRYVYDIRKDTIDEMRYWTGNENVRGDDLDSRKRYIFINKKKVEELELNKDKIQHKTSWLYKKEDNLIVKTDSFFNESNYAYIVSIEKYDSLSNLLSRHYYYQGDLDRPYFYKYADFDKYGNWQIRKGYVVDSILFELTERKIEYYY